MASKFQYKLSNSFIRYSKNTAWIFSERVIRIIILIPITALLARHLGPEQIGTYNLAIALVAIFALIAPLGIPSILVREIVKQKEKTNELVTTTMTIRVISAVVFYGLLITTTYLLQYSKIELGLVSIIGFKLLFQSFDSVDNFLQANVKLRTSSKIRLMALVMVSGVKLYLIFTNAPLLHFTYAYIIEFFLIACLFLWMYAKMHNYHLKFDFNSKTGQYLIRTSLPLIYASALMTINMKVDQVMISKLLDNEANGYYSVVASLIESLYFIPVALGVSLFPGLVKQHAKQAAEYLPSFQLLYEILLILAVGASLLCFFLAPFIIQLLYGDAFEPSIAILKIYAFSPILIFFGSVRNKWLVIENLHHYTAKFLVVALIINIGSNFILLPMIGVTGAVYSLLLSYFTAFILVPYLIPETRLSVEMFFRSFAFRRIRTVLKERKL